MRTKQSSPTKKLISLLLCLVLMVATIPSFTLSASAAALPAPNITDADVIMVSDGDTITGQTTVSFNNLQSGYTLDLDKLPVDITVTGYTGNDGDVLTFTAPDSYAGQSIILAYYKDSVDPDNLLGSADRTTQFVNGYQLTEADVTADLGAGWLDAQRPVDCDSGAAQDYPVISADSVGNVVNVVYTKTPVTPASPSPLPSPSPTPSAGGNPKTGDSSGPVYLYLVAGLAALAGLMTLTVTRKKFLR